MTNRPSTRASAIAVVAASALGVAALVAPAANAAPGTVTLANTLPRWLAGATPAAAPAHSTTMTVRVLLAPRGGSAALSAAVSAVSDPASAQYRHYLTPAQYDATYAPTAQAAATVSAYLRAHGVHVDEVEAHHRYVTATGSRAALAKAFGTTLGDFVHNGQAVVAPTRAVTLPAAVGAQVLTVTGLDTTRQLKKPASTTGDAAVRSTATVDPALTVTPPPGFRNARPCNIDFGTLTATGGFPTFQGKVLPFVTCGYTGPQLRSAYEGTNQAGLDGTGATVAITDAYAWQLMASDASHYAALNGDSPYAKGQYTENLPKKYTQQDACGPSGWSGEETLDVEAVHAMAPGAKIRYYGSSSCLDSDFQTTLARVVDEDKAQIVTNSWSDLEENESTASIIAYEQVFYQGAMQGQSFYFSSGDSGDELAHSGVRQVDYPASDPFVVAAGGTSTAISRGALIGQSGWGTHTYTIAPDGKSWVDGGFVYGAGGGFSVLFDRPSYQAKRVPADSPAGRAVPDVSMDADPNTGMLIGQTQTFPEGVHYDQYRIGGTSLASPLLAGMQALAVQHAGGGLGLVNELFYSPQGRADVTDVLGSGMPSKAVVRGNFNNGLDASGGVTYFARSFNQNSSLSTTKGWDSTTGLGVPDPAFLTAVSPK